MGREMVQSNTVFIELKAFEVVREGRWVHITKRGWKIVKHLRLELTTA